MRNNNRCRIGHAALLAALLVAGWSAVPGRAQRARRPARSPQDLQARMRFEKARELLSLGEDDRGGKMMETVIEQFPESVYRYKAHLALGKNLADRHRFRDALGHLAALRDLKKPDEELAGENRELYLEGLYLTGVANFKTKRYAAAFPILRKITSNYPNTVWANQAYYYIGLCHFAQENWNKAIEALNLVGTFVDPDSPTTEYVEAGQRFYVKVSDRDLPILHQLDRPIRVRISSGRGDAVETDCAPLAMDEGIFIASVPTEVGPPNEDDEVLQVTGGDVITARYVDDNTREGEKDVARQADVTVVSTGSVAFTLGTYQDQASAAFLGQPLFVLLRDADLDTSGKREQATVRVVCRYQTDELEAEESSGLEEDLTYREAETWTVRDEVELQLSELGEAPVRSGRFGGKVPVVRHTSGEPVDRNDASLSCRVGDQVVVSYVDELHIAGTSPRMVEARTEVIDEIDSRPRAMQNVVADPILKAKKNLVEATAYLELARIFSSLGLLDGAKAKASEGLARTESTIRTDQPIPSSLREEAFKLTWELHIAREDYDKAVATCQVFHKLFPDSPFVDEALLGVGRIKLDEEDYEGATRVFREILALENSRAKAEAQYLIARSIEAREGELAEPAIQTYRACARRWPESRFAGESLAKVVDYQIRTRDYRQADELLAQTFQDHPDAAFLDQMLLKWVLVAYRNGEFAKALDKCNQLVFEYPASPYAVKAKKFLPTIKSRLEATP